MKLYLELEKAKAREQEAKKIVAEEKGKNVRLTAKLESVKDELDDIEIELSTYSAGEEARWNSRKKAFIVSLDFYYLLGARSTFLFGRGFEGAV